LHADILQPARKKVVKKERKDNKDGRDNKDWKDDKDTKDNRDTNDRPACSSPISANPRQGSRFFLNIISKSAMQ
jgi:hypothetical protein